MKSFTLKTIKTIDAETMETIVSEVVVECFGGVDLKELDYQIRYYIWEYTSISEDNDFDNYDDLFNIIKIECEKRLDLRE